MNVVFERLTSLRKLMKEEKVDWYFFTSEDFHGSEYVADYFKIREFFTGFTGENGTLLVNCSEAYMWTDGRFFIQAEKELKDTGVTLMKMGEENVPSVIEFVNNNVKKNEVLKFDGRMVSSALGKKLFEACEVLGAKLEYEDDFSSKVWTLRPSMPVNPITVLSEDITGESTQSKIARIREEFIKKGASYNFLSSLDDIAWITNLRGKDVECNPVFLSYLFISESEIKIFMEPSEVDETVRKYLNDNSIEILDYDDVLSFLKNYSFVGKVLLDEGSVNYSCLQTIKSKTEVINSMNPSKRFKAVKNDTEIKRLKEAYIKDSVCVTKFIYWLKNAVKNGDVTEISASDYLDNLRRQVPGFLDLSFPTISGYGSNGAIVHYSATKESNAHVKPEGLLLVDSGGQYLDGTTDVTRTIAVGPVTDKMKLLYSKVMVGMLSLANAKFLYGCTGRNLDILSRAPLWNLGIDFKHGTGHGVGYILNVHEGPQNIRWKFIEGMTEYPIEAGMTTSDEPGVYIEGEFGIRTENVILCEKDVFNEYGQFLKFEHLTYVPLDPEVIDKSVLTNEEIELVNKYQEDVFNKTKDYLNKEEAEWLYKITRPL